MYYVILLALFVTLIISVDVYVNKFKRNKIAKYGVISILLVVLSLMFGYRDELVGVDTRTYKYVYEYIFVPMKSFEFRKDFVWDQLNFIFSRFTGDITYLFLLVAIGYMVLPIFGVNRILKENSLYFLLFFIISPNFFLYGVNGIRNGLAASVFLLSFRYFNQKKQWIWIVLSFLLHLSMIVPAFFYFISKYFKNIKILFIVWFIMLVFAMAGINFLALLPIKIERLDSYVYEGDFTAIKILNIPINFLVYSIAPVASSAYFLLVRKVKDEFFLRLSITYLLASCVYIAAFHSNFVVRFAYLSEFLMALMMIYPIFKFQIKLKYKEIYLSLFLLVVFLIKAFKILVV